MKLLVCLLGKILCERDNFIPPDQRFDFNHMNKELDDNLKCIVWKHLKIWVLNNLDLVNK